MRAIAEFVMRGRPQAIGVCLIGASLPPIHWLCSAVVSLVVLRKGIGEGAFVLLWTCLPLLVFFVVYEDVTPVIALLGTVSLAYILRVTASWGITLGAAVIIAAIGSLIFEMTAADLMNQLVDSYLGFLAEIQAGAGDAQGAGLALILPTEQEARSILFGYIALGYAVSMVAFLILARWWQSLLYNPGGFGQEFHQLRLSPTLGIVLMLGLLMCLGIDGLMRWLNLLTVPLLIASIGFVHWIVAEKKLSRSWLVSFYVLMTFMFQVIMPILATLALMDSWFNLRKYIRSDGEV